MNTSIERLYIDSPPISTNPNLPSPYLPGNSILSPTTVAATVNRLCYLPIVLQSPKRLYGSSVAIMSTDPLGVIRTGLVSCDSNWLPNNNVVFDFGLTNGTVLGDARSLLPNPTILNPGRYLSLFVADTPPAVTYRVYRCALSDSALVDPVGGPNPFIVVPLLAGVSPLTPFVNPIPNWNTLGSGSTSGLLHFSALLVSDV